MVTPVTQNRAHVYLVERLMSHHLLLLQLSPHSAIDDVVIRRPVDLFYTSASVVVVVVVHDHVAVVAVVAAQSYSSWSSRQGHAPN